VGEFANQTLRFFCKGICLSHPADVLPEGKFPLLENVRSYIEGLIDVREGTLTVATTTEPIVHTVSRLNDGTPFNEGVLALRVVGAGPSLFMGPPPGGALTAVDTGFSGDPLTTLAIQPVGTVQPWLYVADRLRQRKLSVDGTIFNVGIAPPLVIPRSKLPEPKFLIIDNFEYAAGTMPWLTAGSLAGAPTQTPHVNTTISAILYDQGSTGNALVGLTSMVGIGRGLVVVINNAESVLVQDVKIPIVPSTIAGILYDNLSGPGLCTIQPAGGLGTGQLYLPSADYLERMRPTHGLTEDDAGIRTPPPLNTPAIGQAIRSVDFPVDCLIKIGSELVRILSVAVGRDGVQSFRCSTTSVHTVGTSIVGFSAIRAYLKDTHVVGSPVTTQAVQQTLAVPTVPAPDPDDPEPPPPDDVVAGMRSGYPNFYLLPNVPPGGGDPDDPEFEPGGEYGSLYHKDIVERAKREVLEEGLVTVFDNACASYQVTLRTAQILSGEGAGLLAKDPPHNQCNNRAVDVIVYPDGTSFDVLHNSCSVSDPPGTVRSNDPTWRLSVMEDPDDYRPVGNNPIPPPPTARATPADATTALNLSKIGDRMTHPEDEFHLSINIDKLEHVKEIRIFFDVDATANDFTRNVYYFVFSRNDLIEAVQQFNAIGVVPIMDQMQRTAIPRDQTRTYMDRYPWIRTAQDIEAEQQGLTPYVYPSYIDRYPWIRTASDIEAERQAAEAGVQDPVSGQLALGNGQWMELRWRVKHMLRIGTDPTRTLKDIRGIEILVQYNPVGGKLLVKYDSLWLGGGYGADVGEIGQPYTYTYRYRSSETGAKSNPAPPQRAGVIPRRQRVELVATPSTDPSVDKIDWFRLGGALPDWRYIGTAPNNGNVFNDDIADDNVGQDPVVFDDYQPWPTQDRPRHGTCQVAGSAIKWLSGDPFDVRWAPGTQIRIAGNTCTVFAQPPNATFLEVVENAGAYTSTDFEVATATILGATFPTLFGPFEHFYFAVGDPTNPGQLNWTKGNDPDVTSDKNTLYVTSPSTPLMNGFVWEQAAFVFSTEDLYRILPDFSKPNVFTTQLTPCGRGLWTRWCWCLTPYGVVFLAKDGIYITNAGSPAKSLTDKDLYPIFPREGIRGAQIRDVQPPDMTRTTDLRLGYGDGYIYFDFVAITGGPYTLIYDMKRDGWFIDKYPSRANVHAWDPGAGVHDVLLGTVDGKVKAYAHGTGDDGNNIPWLIRTPHYDGGDPRKEKLFGDFAISFDAAGGNGATVQAGFNNFSHSRIEPAQGPIAAGVEERREYYFDINDGYGEMAKNMAIQITGADTVVPTPSVNWWSASVIPKGDQTGKRATDWDDAGYFGAKWMQGVLIEADPWSGGKPEHWPGTPGPRTVRVEYDGGQLGAIITIEDTNGQGQTPHSFPQPFIAHLVRLVPTDADDWVLYRHRWVWEPSPELAAYWITQPTTHDFPGYGHDERVLIPHMSIVDFDLIVTADGKSETYRILQSGGVFVKTEVLLKPNKGKVYQYQLRSVDGTEGMRIFLKDIEVRGKYWGSPEPYQILRPFGDLSREFGGARI
jgi:hypothetical protein